MLKKMASNDLGKIIISCILGLGLASLFKKICVDDNCLIIKSPPINKIQNKIFGLENKCYKYNPKMTECGK